MTSFTLKVIAIVSMTIDHAGKVLGQAILLELFPDTLTGTFTTVKICIVLGRMAFPLFAFMLAEGCSRTRSMPRYLGRLALFAVISEPVFSAALIGFDLNDTWQSIRCLVFRNVFFTLFLAALSIFLSQKLTCKYGAKGQIVSIALTCCLAFAASYFGTDYGAMGVLLIHALYLLRGNRVRQCAAIVIWAFALYVAGNWTAFLYMDAAIYVFYALGASLACVPILLYNGKRGRPMKWTFYVYYPAHLLALVLIREALGV